jgi:PIN domain nuclease of toxin-antitoxin system
VSGAFLLDTHTFLWLMSGSGKLSKKARALFADERAFLLLSVASVWEIALKSDKGKIVAPAELVDDAIAAFRIEELPVRTSHVRRASLLPVIEGHKDPFDRLIAAQAILEDVPLVTNDAWLRRHYEGLSIIW